MRKNNTTRNKKDVIAGKADLHIHSNYSDGYFTPQEIIERAHQLGLSAISITDHDNIDAIEPARLYCHQCGIEFIPGIEISSIHGKKELHFLGYFFDYRNKILNEYIEFFRQEREKRAQKIIELFNTMGIKISLESVIEKAYPGSIGRPHIAHLLLEQGYVLSYQEAFNKYLGDDRPCFVPKYRMTPTEVIKIINQAGGISFIAHPGIDINEDCMLRLIKLGLEGIETIHPRHSPDQIEYYRKLIKKYHLLECGGSDFHGNYLHKPKLGEFTVPYQFVTNMKRWLNIKGVG